MEDVNYLYLLSSSSSEQLLLLSELLLLLPLGRDAAQASLTSA